MTSLYTVGGYSGAFIIHHFSKLDGAIYNTRGRKIARFTTIERLLSAPAISATLKCTSCVRVCLYTALNSAASRLLSTKIIGLCVRNSVIKRCLSKRGGSYITRYQKDIFMKFSVLTSTPLLYSIFFSYFKCVISNCLKKRCRGHLKNIYSSSAYNIAQKCTRLAKVYK